MKKKCSELKQGDIIIHFGQEAIVKKIETSGKGIKQGRVKCRIEAEKKLDSQPISFVRLADDEIEVK